MIKEGIMITKDGKGWGVAYKDGQCRCEDWVDIDRANIYSAYVNKPEDVTPNDFDKAKLRQGKMVFVKRIIKTIIVNELEVKK